MVQFPDDRRRHNPALVKNCWPAWGNKTGQQTLYGQQQETTAPKRRLSQRIPSRTPGRRRLFERPTQRYEILCASCQIWVVNETGAATTARNRYSPPRREQRPFWKTRSPGDQWTVVQDTLDPVSNNCAKVFLIGVHRIQPEPRGAWDRHSSLRKERKLDFCSLWSASNETRRGGVADKDCDR